MTFLKGNNVYFDRSLQEIQIWINKTADFGADHFRACLAWGAYYANPTSFYNMSVSDFEANYFFPALDKLNQCLGLIVSRGLSVVLDYHMPVGGWVPDGLNNKMGCMSNDVFRAAYIQHWRYMASQYKDIPCVVAYDLLNEPLNTPKIWRPLAIDVINAIKEVTAGKTIIVESNYGDPRKLEPCYIDNSITYSFHTYDPIHFCLKGAYGIKPEPYGGKQQILNVVQSGIDFAEKYKVKMYVGEVGCSNLNEDVQSQKWAHDMFGILRHNKYAFAYHSFGDNGLFDPKGSTRATIQEFYK